MTGSVLLRRAMGEQSDLCSYDTLVDVWALGCTAYQMMYGEAALHNTWLQRRRPHSGAYSQVCWEAGVAQVHGLAIQL